MSQDKQDIRSKIAKPTDFCACGLVNAIHFVEWHFTEEERERLRRR